MLSLLLSPLALAEQPGKSVAAKANQCLGCHNIPGYMTAFPEAYRVPKIIGQSPLYLESALKEYKNGERMHPSMSAIAAQLSEEDIKQLAEYYANLGQPQ